MTVHVQVDDLGSEVGTRISVIRHGFARFNAVVGQCPMLGPYQQFGRTYDDLIVDLSAGLTRQQRLRNYPALPIPRPCRAELVAAPTSPILGR
ncbi:hypothetical protein ACWEKT_26385 [Nocardia takedensis]